MTKKSSPKSKSSFSWVFALLFGLAFLVMFIQNQEDVEWTFFWNKVHLPLSLIVTINFTLGLLLGILLLFPGRWRLYRNNKKLKKELEEVNKPKKEDQTKNDIS
jgi:uncharacterized integral membrane protein